LICSFAAACVKWVATSQLREIRVVAAAQMVRAPAVDEVCLILSVVILRRKRRERLKVLIPDVSPSLTRTWQRRAS